MPLHVYIKIIFIFIIYLAIFIFFISNIAFVFLYIVLGFCFIYLFYPQFDFKLIKLRRKIKSKRIALTFDDGPAKATPRILNILENHNIKATFFVIGKKVEKYPNIIKEIISKSHVLGNHTYSHKILTFLKPHKIKEEIKNCENTIFKSVNYKTKYIRTPHGFRSLFLNKILKEFNYTLVSWTKGIWDTDLVPSNILLSRVKRKNKNLEILLLHDGKDLCEEYNPEELLRVLPEIIGYYKENGYNFVTIEELYNDK
jgi:peptidoglycan/xylan/chitin deacetylase (PgdA/CDA1 family)